MIIYDVEQGSDEWFHMRLGKPTASEFHKIITAKGRKPSAQADGYIEQLVGEQLAIYYPERVENFTNKAIRWGQECEAEARRWYAMETGNVVKKVGFVTTDDGKFGCSPDGLIYHRGELREPVGLNYEPIGGLELKCPLPATHVGYLMKNEMPADYLAQVHGALIVTGLPWWDFVSYCPGLPGFKITVTPNEFTAELRGLLDAFYVKYQSILEKVKTL